MKYIGAHVSAAGGVENTIARAEAIGAAALASLRSQVPAGCTQGFSHSRTCEMGLSHHAGIPYQSILYLVDQAAG